MHCTSIHYCLEKVMDKRRIVIALERKSSKVQDWDDKKDDEFNFGHESEQSYLENISVYETRS